MIYCEWGLDFRDFFGYALEDMSTFSKIMDGIADSMLNLSILHPCSVQKCKSHSRRPGFHQQINSDPLRWKFYIKPHSTRHIHSTKNFNIQDKNSLFDPKLKNLSTHVRMSRRKIFQDLIDITLLDKLHCLHIHRIFYSMILFRLKIEGGKRISMRKNQQ